MTLLPHIVWCIVALAGCFAALSPAEASEVRTGAELTDSYVPRLHGKRVALYTNHSGRVGDRMTVDVLLDSGISVVTLFSPEHGIRGTADAGEHVASSVDKATGIPVISLYGGKYRDRMDAAVAASDIVVVDIQDVGLRFYTYYITMMELMNSAARAGRPVMVLDRPNPLGMMVDGPTLDMKYASGVGHLPIPVAHGLTLGELASMIVGEGWLEQGRGLDLTVIPCRGYTHSTRYALPVPPSPNLPDMHAVYLYPSMCYFEATPMSLGRGTDFPFQVYGHPDMKGGDFRFTPTSRPGARKPPLMGRECRGIDLRNISDDSIIARGIDLSYLIDAYRRMGSKPDFLTPFFEKLIGNAEVRRMIERGADAAEIKASWQADVDTFKCLRRRYLLYPE